MNQNTEQIAYEVDGQIMTKDQYDEAQREQLQTLYKLFVGQRDEWVKYRSNLGVEKRWRMAQQLYSGESDGDTDSDFVDQLKNGPKMRGSAQQNNRSKVVINIVRPKVEQAIARMCEILLPVDDKNWGIKPTPVPQNIQGMVGNQAPTVEADGQPTGRTADQEAQMLIKASKDAAKAMEREIDDVLTQCDYNGEQRKAISDGVILGPAMMLGPFPKQNAKRSWIPDGEGLKLQISSDISFGSMRADPWDIWFDPACGNNHQRGLGFYHRRFTTRKELRGLKGIPGYDERALEEVLREKPTRIKAAEGRITRQQCDEDSYEMWVYYGQVEPDQMEMLTANMGNPLTDVVDAMIIIVGDRVIGALESPVPDGSLPIDVWCWRKADDHPYGDNLPMELIHQQRVVNASWRQVMDDAKFSVGGQLIIKKKMIQPVDGSYVMYPGKPWVASDELDDVRKAMAMIEFANHSAPLLGIAEAAMKFADQETSMPQLLGGDKGQQAPETLGGMVMLYNNAQTVLRLKVKLYDDDMTRPHIRRHFDCQMAHNQKAEIRGDMDIDARGSTALLERDIQNQATLNLANITSNPRYAAYVDPKEELKVILRAMKVTPEDIMLTDDKIEANMQQAQQQPQDPRIAAAQIQAQTKEMEIADRKEQRQVDAQLAAEDAQIKREQIQYTAERERADGEQGMAKLQIDRELAIAQMSQDGQESELERQSKERLQAVQLDVKTQLFSAEAAIKARQGSGI
jgi:hypothetical protein